MRRFKHPDGYPLIDFTAKLVEPQTSLSVTGGPVRDTEHLLIVFSKSQSKRALKSCELRVVVDGQPVKLPEVRYRAEGSTEQLRMTFSVSQFAEWAQAQRVIAQACDVRFELTQEAMKLTREFLMRFQEELALNGKITPANAGPAPSDSL